MFLQQDRCGADCYLGQRVKSLHCCVTEAPANITITWALLLFGQHATIDTVRSISRDITIHWQMLLAHVVIRTAPVPLRVILLFLPSCANLPYRKANRRIYFAASLHLSYKTVGTFHRYDRLRIPMC